MLSPSVLKIVEPNKMYNTAKENPAGAVAELYETGAQIATYGDRGE